MQFGIEGFESNLLNSAGHGSPPYRPVQLPFGSLHETFSAVAAFRLGP